MILEPLTEADKKNVEHLNKIICEDESEMTIKEIITKAYQLGRTVSKNEKIN